MTFLSEMLSFDFMQRALAAALIVGFLAPIIGTFLVQRGLALMGDGLGHLALAGVALGFATQSMPLITSLAVVVAGSVTIELLRERGHIDGQFSLALLFYTGLAMAPFLTSLSPTGAQNQLMAYLFGSISTVTTTDLAWIAALAVGVMAVTALFGREMLAVCIDQEAAHTAGVRVRAMNLLIALTAAVTVVIGMRVVGSLLISAFMIVPVAASSVVARSFWSAMAGGVAIGVIAGAGGLTASYAMGTVPPGPTIVLTALACFAVLTAFGAPTRRILRGRAVSRDRAAADARAARDEASAAPIGG